MWDKDTVIHLSPLKNFVFPSFQMAEKIKGILAERKQNPFIEKGLYPKPSVFFGASQYEERTSEELENNLAIVHKTYADEDYYELFEQNSYKVNLLVENKGNEYIEDATVEIEFPKIDGFFIADKIYPKPYHKSSPYELPPLRSDFENMYYPGVTEKNDSILVRQTIGDIKHQIPINAFRVPIRIVIGHMVSGMTIEVKCKIFAKNLTQPVMTNVKIIIDD